MQPLVPLYLSLCLLAYPRSGTVLVDKAGLATVLSLDPSTLDRQLKQLERAKWVHVRTQGLYLALSIRSWPGKQPPESLPTLTPKGGEWPAFPPSTTPPLSASAEYKKQNRSAETESKGNLEAEQSLGDGKGSLRGKEEGWLEPFLDRLVRTVGLPEERSSYRSFCRRYPRPLLETALDRVRQTPKSRIRKSRGALFTYLVKTFDQTSKKP